MSKILIVEDDSEIALLERDYLEIEGLESDVVSDGESAVSAALSGGYDLVLLDLMLPGLNGYDVCRQIRDRVDVPILWYRPHRLGGQDPGPGSGGRRLYRQTV